MVVRSNSCRAVDVVWGMAITELLVEQTIYEVNGHNVNMRVSTISQLGIPFLSAQSRRGREFLLNQLLEHDELIIKDENGRDHASFIARGSR